MSPCRPPASYPYHPEKKKNSSGVDITNLAVVFGETGGGQLSQRAWEDLKATRWQLEIFVIQRRDVYNLYSGT
jgi:hypothetical protein